MLECVGVSTHIALLRGINVGGKNSMPMKTLIAIFERAGCTGVRTYIQSGNVVFETSAVSRAVSSVTRACSREFGFEIPIVVRTARELRAVTTNNPFFEKKKTDTDALHVVFLADVPDAKSVAALDPNRSPPDELAVRGREIYLRCPNGIGRSKLTNAWFDTTLGTISTMRNWRTVLALLEMAS